MNLTFNILIVLSLWGLATVANAQSKTLLEACNAIDDRTKRIECLEEVMQLSDKKDASSKDQTAAIKRAKATFFAIASTVRSGVSYKNYSTLIIEPAKELGMLREEVPNLDPLVFEALSQVVNAYNDAAIVWQASIFESQDAGFFGKILNTDRPGIAPIVHRYDLKTTSILLNTHLPVNEALIKIWTYAEALSRNAFNVADGTAPSSSLIKVTCDKWGNPKQNDGSPCTPN